MEHSRYLVSVDYQQRITPFKMDSLCDHLKQAEKLGRKWVEVPTKYSRAEISYLALYGYRVIEGDWGSSRMTEIVWN